MDWLISVPITVWLTLIIIMAYGYSAILSNNVLAINLDILEFYGASRTALVEGRYWVIITSVFIHQDLLHLALNLFSLMIIGIVFEMKGGRRHFLVIFFLSALLTLLFSITIFPSWVFIGASAAIFGLAGATIMRQIKSAIYGTLFILALFAFTNPFSFLAHGFGVVVGVITDQLIIKCNNSKTGMLQTAKVTPKPKSDEWSVPSN